VVKPRFCRHFSDFSHLFLEAFSIMQVVISIASSRDNSVRIVEQEV
jgi:hypothetical protein